MKNYLTIDGRKIELTDEQVEEIRKSFETCKTKLSDIAIGDTFTIGEYEFIVLDHSKETTAVILKDLLYNAERFGTSNNYNDSNVDVLCYKFAEEIKGIVGAKNLVEHTVDLTSDDGLKDYGKVRRYASLLTTHLYRRYVEILDKHKIEKWWWLATAYSTPAHDHTSWAKCVSPRGYVRSINYFYSDYGGVRPFCILNSNIFVSK